MSRALPPVGWQSIIEHEPQRTVVCAWLNTVVMLKQPGHFTSMKKELGDCTKRLSLCFRFSSLAEGWRRSRTMVLVALLLLGTCGGDRGLLAARRAARSLGVFLAALGGSAGGEVSRAVPRLQRRVPTRSVALRRPALAVGRGVVPAGGRRGVFLSS